MQQDSIRKKLKETNGESASVYVFERERESVCVYVCVCVCVRERETEREKGQAICINQRMDMNVPFLCTLLPSPFILLNPSAECK